MENILMKEKSLDPYGLRELQNCILGIMVYIDEICQEHGIEYCLMGGSAIGAKRHSGFIPWDDDLDIFMTPDNYEKFRQVFNALGDKGRFYLQEYGLVDGMVTLSKLRLNGTTYIEEIVKDWDMHHGVYVDIFILHSCPNNRLLQLYQCLWAKYIILLGLSHRGYAGKGGLAGLLLKIFKIFPKKFLLRQALKEQYRYRHRRTNYYCNFLGKAVFTQGIYERKWFEEYLYVPFEQVELKVPVGLHEFLTKRFGNYMRVPSPEQIKAGQHVWKWDVKRDFRELMPHIHSFSDEKFLL